MLIKQKEFYIDLFKNEDFLKNNYISYFLENNQISLRLNLYSRDENLHRISLFNFLHVVNEYKITNLEDKRIIPFLEELSIDSLDKENKNNYLFDVSISIQSIVLSLFTNNTDEEFMMGAVSLSLNQFRESKPFQFNIHYVLKDKKSGFLYSTEIPVFTDDIFDLLTNEYISMLCKHDIHLVKRMILSTSMTSFYSFIKKLNKTDNFILEECKNHIYKNVFTFLEKKKEKNFITNLIGEVLLPYKTNLSFLCKDLNSLDLKISINQRLCQSLLKETNPLKQVQHFLPKANKQTVKTLKEFFDNPFEDSDDLFHYSKTIDYVFMNLFTTTERLNKFIQSILFFTDDTNDSIEYILDKRDSHYKKVYDFVENDLIKFFNSRETMENFLIKQMHLFTEEAFESSYIEEEIYEEEDDGNDDDFYSHKETNFEKLIEELRELHYIYSRFEEMKKELKDNQTKENMEKYYLMETVYNKKYNTLKDIHDELYLLYTDLKNEKINYQLSGLKETTISLEDYSLSEVSSSTTLKEVGTRMNHCVATYENKILNKESFIFIVRNNSNNKFEICLEYDAINNKIIQAKGNRNSIVRNKKVLNLVELFKEKNDLIIETNDLPSKFNN